MAKTQIGVQMYTLRDFCKTPADIASTCKRLKDMGFGAVQASALGPIDARELRKILDDNGLVCAATHRSLDQMRDVNKITDEHATLGCELTAIGGFGFGGAPPTDWEKFADEYNQLARPLAAKGLKIGYHNHSHELSPFATDPAKLDPRQCPQELLLQKLDSAVWFEIDTYWIQHGGGDPALWIERCKGRIPAIHVKDMTISPKREHKMCEVGAGNLNWPRILQAGKAAGVQWYLIERDSGDLDPFESLKISLANLQAMGLQ
jgi:sugar phosphate isomerase/epimerase